MALKLLLINGWSDACCLAAPSQYLYQYRNIVSSLAPGICGHTFKCTISKFIIKSSSSATCCAIALGWIPRNVTNETSMLVQVWLGAVRQQTINWANVDPYLRCHIVSLVQDELIEPLKTDFCTIKILLYCTQLLTKSSVDELMSTGHFLINCITNTT